MAKITFDRDNNVRVDGKPTSYYVRQGSYSGTTDDRLGRWYIGRHGEFFRPHGAGHRTRKEAADWSLDTANY